MRDPNRIARVLDQLGQYWMQNPDLRLGQIVSNVNYAHRRDNGLPSNNDVFYLEDEDFLESLWKESS